MPEGIAHSTEDDHVVAVVLASAGRPGLLGQMIDSLFSQTFREFILVVSVPDAASLPADDLPSGSRLVHASGLTKQRNAGLDAAREATHVFFFDDDAVVRDDYIESAMAFFGHNPDVVALTGRVLLDGAVGEAIPLSKARGVLADSLLEVESGSFKYCETLYGCNFAVRSPSVFGERFDERLPLYGWLEDHDFARRMLRHGRLATVDDCAIVHCGVKSGGRTAHKRLGYAQGMNPAYFWRSGSFPARLAFRETWPRVAKNALGSLFGPERKWRRRRLMGNAMALADLCAGRFTPERMSSIPLD